MTKRPYLPTIILLWRLRKALLCLKKLLPPAEEAKLRLLKIQAYKIYILTIAIDLSSEPIRLARSSHAGRKKFKYNWHTNFGKLVGANRGYKRRCLRAERSTKDTTAFFHSHFK